MKKKFSYAERFAVWSCHSKRCWLCTEPLRLAEATVDHVIPESLILDDAKRQAIFDSYGLSNEFNINGFENWLPAHSKCNQQKGNKTFEFIPGIRFILDKLLEKASRVKIESQKVSENVNKDKLFGTIFAAIEKKKVTSEELKELLFHLSEEPSPTPVRDDILLMDRGYWVYRKDVAREGLCECERENCVDFEGKIYCYFRPDHSDWVIGTGLYWKCYDEVIPCPRCQNLHKRGHIGKIAVCGNPFLNQIQQSD